MNFEFIATYVELQDIPSYSTNITVEGQLLKLSFLWNERIGKRVLSIKNTSDVVYLQNTILHPNEPLELNSNAVLDDLPYSVTLVKTGDSSRFGNIFNWSKDFILCFSRTVDLDVKKLNVVYGVTTPSTPTLPKPFGDWILNEGYQLINNEFLRYTAYKTNTITTYDSFASYSLQDAVFKSLFDSDMQQWGAVNNAAEDLTEANSWTFDNTNQRIVYMFDLNTVSQYLYRSPDNGQYYESTVGAVNGVVCNRYYNQCYVENESTRGQYIDVDWCGRDISDGSLICSQIQVEKVPNPSYDPNLSEERYVSYEVLAQKIVSNLSSPNEGVSLLVEVYVNAVALSIFNTDTSKQFVKMTDIITELETNKVIR